MVWGDGLASDESQEPAAQVSSSAIAPPEPEQPVISAAAEVEEVEPAALSTDTPAPDQTPALDELFKVGDAPRGLARSGSRLVGELSWSLCLGESFYHYPY